jgi:hypothetical protein
MFWERVTKATEASGDFFCDTGNNAQRHREVTYDRPCKAGGAIDSVYIGVGGICGIAVSRRALLAKAL